MAGVGREFLLKGAFSMIDSRKNMRLGTCCLPALALLGGCVTTGQLTPVNQLASVESKAECPELRPTVVVGAFDAGVPEVPQDVGPGLTDMLVAAMAETGCYRMMDPTVLAAAGGGSAAGAPDLARRVGADLFIVGRVTEFEPDASGADVGVAGGEKLPDWLKDAGLQVASSKISLSVRLVDARTGEVLAAKTLAGSAQDLGGEVSESRFGLKLAAYAKTPMGQAMQAAIDEATAFMLTRTADQAVAYQEAALTQ
jgi:curli biogenesis system outer membrane secretion channel CsgG